MKISTNLAKQDSIRVIGLMSGTSLDGLDLADIQFKSKKYFPIMEFKKYVFIPYNQSIRKKIKSCIKKQNNIEILDLSYELGHFFAKVILQYTKKNSCHKKIDLIASHGQSIYHQGGKYSQQIGEADIIALKTKIPVVFDFRSADIARGKQGAPLVVYFDEYLQKTKKEKILFLNLGGIANFSILKEKKMLSSDTGPANILLNLLVSKKTKNKYICDQDGIFAKKGKINEALYKELLAHPFLSKTLPKSTGYEDFGEVFLNNILFNYTHLDWKDILRTLTLFSATSIADCCKKFINTQSIIAVSGGGIHNPILMEDLRKFFKGYCVQNFSEIFGFDSDAKEAVAFAYFAYQRIQKNSALQLGKIAYLEF